MRGNVLLDVERLKESLREKVPEDLLAVIETIAGRCMFDPYLEVPNRFYLEVFGRREVELSRRAGKPMSVLFIDVDNLKKVNDTLGHLAGDIYLKKIVQMVRACMRASDVLVRWGGDEFVALLQTDEKGALLVKERIERAVNDRKVLVGSRELVCSVSVGWAQVKNSLLSAIYLADVRMYEEKRRKKDERG